MDGIVPTLGLSLSLSVHNIYPSIMYVHSLMNVFTYGETHARTHACMHVCMAAVCKTWRTHERGIVVPIGIRRGLSGTGEQHAATHGLWLFLIVPPPPNSSSVSLSFTLCALDIPYSKYTASTRFAQACMAKHTQIHTCFSQQRASMLYYIIMYTQKTNKHAVLCARA